MAENFYATLEVERDASDEDIAKAYRDLARRYHPDVNPDDADAEQRFKEVQRAFEVLGNREKRAAYDDTIRPVRRPKYDPNIEKVHLNPPPPCRRWRADPCIVDLVWLPAICLLAVGLAIPVTTLYFVRTTEPGSPEAMRLSDEEKRAEALLDEWLPLIHYGSVLIGLAVMAGAISMWTLRVYPLAVLAAILTIVPCCVGNPFGLFGGLVGVWALMILSDADVRNAFWGE